MFLRSRSCPGLCNGLLSRLKNVPSAAIYRLEVEPMDGGMYQVDAYLRVRRAVMVDGVSVQEVSRVFGEYKYWLMTDYNEIDPYNDEGGYVLNRARLYRDRRDFVIQPGDTGRPEDYPVSPAHPAGG